MIIGTDTLDNGTKDVFNVLVGIIEARKHVEEAYDLKEHWEIVQAALEANAILQSSENSLRRELEAIAVSRDAEPGEIVWFVDEDDENRSVKIVVEDE